MISRSELMRKVPTAVSSNGDAAVMVAELLGKPCVYAFAPRSIGSLERRDEFNILFELAMNKMGWRRDGRCKIGWRKVNRYI